VRLNFTILQPCAPLLCDRLLTVCCKVMGHLFALRFGSLSSFDPDTRSGATPNSERGRNGPSGGFSAHLEVAYCCLQVSSCPVLFSASSTRLLTGYGIELASHQ